MKLRIILWGIMLALIAGNASASVVISQVLYDPAGTESGGEAIELYNNGNNDLDISGWKIATESTANDATIPESTVICAGCYYLIADSGWNESRDNLSWPEADLEEPISLYNDNSGVALTLNNTPIDAVGWGNPDSIDEGLFEGTPFEEAEEGKSILRTQDTGNNIHDFNESIPFFRSSSDIGTGSDSANVEIEFNVINSTENKTIPLSIEHLKLVEGVKITPLAGGMATATVEALVMGQPIDNVAATFSGAEIALSKTQEVNSTASVFSGSFSLSYYMPPADYSIEVKAESGKNSEEMEIEFEYLALVAIELSAETVNFGKISPSEDEYSDIAVKNIGNTKIDLGLKCPNTISEAIKYRNNHGDY